MNNKEKSKSVDKLQLYKKLNIIIAIILIINSILYLIYNNIYIMTLLFLNLLIYIYIKYTLFKLNQSLKPEVKKKKK